MCNCKIDIFKDFIRINKGLYICPICKKDIIIILVFASEIKEQENSKRAKNKTLKRKINNKKN
jgi:hypothetical protein